MKKQLFIHTLPVAVISLMLSGFLTSGETSESHSAHGHRCEPGMQWDMELFTSADISSKTVAIGEPETSGKLSATGESGEWSAMALPNPYRALGSWGKLPEGRSWGAVIGVFPDSKGNIWVLERCGRNTCLGSDLGPIVKLDPEGNYVTSFGAGLFAWPHGFFIDDNDNIWVTDAEGMWIPDAQAWAGKVTGKGHAVMKFSPDGELLMVLGKPGVAGKDKEHFNQPSDVVVADDGSIFVADGHQLRGNSRIVKFTPEGDYVLEWGEMGTDLGQFRDPHAIAIDSRGRVFVGDRMNNRIQIFDQEGNFLEVWTQFGRPSGIFFTDEDMMYVADSESNYQRNPGWERGIRIGSARDGWVRYFISDPVPNPDNVGTSGAEYVAADKSGNVYAAEVGPRKLNKYIRLWPLKHDD